MKIFMPLVTLKRLSAYGLLVWLIGLAQFSYSQSKELKKILFIGNSLTYVNNLPDLVQEEASSLGIKVSCEMIAYPNYALEDHWHDGKVQKLIKSKSYDFVIIQQGPSSQTYGKTSLVDYGMKLSKACKTSNTKLVYFMVWPSMHFYQTFAGVIKNYTAAAQKNNAMLAPVGEVWKAHFDKTNDFSYYGADGFHPSMKGSKIAAQIIVKTLFSD